MRENKFKVYCTKTGTVFHNPVIMNDRWYTDTHNYELDISNKDDGKGQHLVQYTGLKDKNGVEIYEGDILSSTKFEPSEVIYEESYGAFFASDCTLHEFITFSKIGLFGDVEVIGNKYQNPELLVDK